MLGTRSILLGVLLPAAICASTCLALERPRRGERADRRPGAVATRSAAIALALAYAAGHALLFGWPAFPPQLAEQWIVYAALLAVAFGLLLAVPAVAPRWLGWGFRLALLVAAFGPLLRPMYVHHWSAEVAVAATAALLALALAFWIELEWIVPALEPRSAWLVLLAAGGGAALALGLTGSLSLAQLAAVLAAAAGGGFVVACLGAARAPDGPATFVPATILGGLLLCGRFYSELPSTSALLLAAAPLGTRLVPGASGGRTSARDVLRVGMAVVVPIAVAIVLAYRSSPSFGRHYGP